MTPAPWREPMGGPRERVVIPVPVRGAHWHMPLIAGFGCFTSHYTLILPQYSLPPQGYVRNRDQPWVVDGTFLTPDVNGCVYDGR